MKRGVEATEPKPRQDNNLQKNLLILGLSLIRVRKMQIVKHFGTIYCIECMESLIIMTM